MRQCSPYYIGFNQCCFHTQFTYNENRSVSWTVLVRRKHQLSILFFSDQYIFFQDDLNNLGELTAKWRQASQEILVDLQNALPEPKPSMADLLRSYQIDFKLMRYNEDEDCFT